MTYVMLCGKPPFWGSREQHVRAAKAERFPISDAPWNRLPKAVAFVKKLIIAKPGNRPSAAEVLDSDWFKVVETNETEDKEVSKGVYNNLRNFCAQSTFKRMCITAVARQLDHKHLKDIHQVFRKMDANGDGVLSFQEISKGFKELFGKDAPEEEYLRKLFNNMDVDGSESIDYTEFCAAGLDEKMSEQDDVIWAAFKTFDIDNSGKISIDNLRRLLDSADIKDAWSAEVCADVGKEIVEKFDKDGDGEICFEDWKGLMTACWSASKAPAAAESQQNVDAYEILTMVSNAK